LPQTEQRPIALTTYHLVIRRAVTAFAAWSTLAFWDLGRRTNLSRGAAIGWTAVILLLPFIGALAYHVVGGSEIPKPLRATVVGGGLAIFALALLVGRLLGTAAA